MDNLAPEAKTDVAPAVQAGEGGSIPTLALQDLRFGSISRSQASWCVNSWHYSGGINGVKSSHLFGITHPSLLGAAVFGPMATTAWRGYGDREGDVLELRRLAVSDECPKNTESRFVAWCIRALPHSFKVLVSYADPAHGHSGGIYKALGFEERGRTPPDHAWRFDGKIFHSRAPRTKYNGRLKPFAAKLAKAIASGEAERIPLPGKIIFVKELE